MDLTLVMTAISTPPDTHSAGGRVPSARDIRKPRKRRADVQAIETTTNGFADLADIWERETRNSSDIAENLQHWAYQAILRMGPPVIPSILDRMRTRGGFWFTALAKLANYDPVMPAQWGDTAQMREAWFRWERLPDAANIRRYGARYILPNFSETT